MRAFLLNAADSGNPDCRQGADALSRALDDFGLDVSEVHLAEMSVAPCKGCFGCWVSTPGECLQTDALKCIAGQVVSSDLWALYAPLAFGGYGWRLKQVLDRLIGLVSPLFEWGVPTRHRPRYSRYPAMLGVGWLPAPDPEQERLFARIVARNACNMHAPASAALVLAGDKDWAVRRKICLAALGGLLP